MNVFILWNKKIYKVKCERSKLHGPSFVRLLESLPNGYHKSNKILKIGGLVQLTKNKVISERRRSLTSTINEYMTEIDQLIQDLTALKALESTPSTTPAKPTI
jgi:DNA primase large subunit